MQSLKQLPVIVAVITLAMVLSACSPTLSAVSTAGIISVGCAVTSQELKDKIIEKQKEKKFRTYICGE